MKIGYLRVSTRSQHTRLQLDALEGCDRIYEDIGVPGGAPLAKRPGLQKALDHLREGDQLIVWRIDRLGRSTKRLLTILEKIEKTGADFVSITENIDTTLPSGRMIFTMISAMAELEAEIIRQRVKSGLEAARKRGKVGGRPRKLDKKQERAMRRIYKTGEMSVLDICRSFGISSPTFYEYRKRWKK